MAVRFCLPSWHAGFAALEDVARIDSRCESNRVTGNAPCAPEVMRAHAEAAMAARGLWRGHLPLTTYTLARYIASEVGSGTPEEKIAVAEAAHHRVAIEGLDDVNDLLLYRQRLGHPNRGFYGPIHGAEGIATAPFGRWAATSQDPKPQDILIAHFVLSGASNNFSQGADDQFGLEKMKNPIASVERRAEKRKYWVGPLPNVNHWKTFLFRSRSDVHPESPTGQALTERAVAAASDRRLPDWSGLAACPRWQIPVGGAFLLFLAAGFGLSYSIATLRAGR